MTNPSSNRAAFDTAIGTALTTLNSSIDAAISNLLTASTLSTQIQGELLGTGTTTLQGQLAAIPTPNSASFRAAIRFALRHRSDGLHGDAASRLRPCPGGDDYLGDGADRSPDVRSDLQCRREDDPAALRDDYPWTNRAAFDKAVGTALTTLNTSIHSALSNLPASVSASLGTTISNDLLTGTQTTGTSLQSRLAAVGTPGSTGGFQPWFFRLGSSLNIGFAQGRVASNLVAAVNTYNKLALIPSGNKGREPRIEGKPSDLRPWLSGFCLALELGFAMSGGSPRDTKWRTTQLEDRPR